MNVKQAIRNVINEAKCQIDAERDGDDSIARMRRRCVNLMLEPIDRWADMAEAAIALAEFTSHWWFLHKPLPNWDERFDELVKAFEKAKEACNSPAGEGET